MGGLRIEEVLKEKQCTELNSITSISLSYKALSDVSCLTQLSNLERLDLSSNNLTSLEGLRLCINLKWLSVVQNKLQSLNGIEKLSKLTVLNAGKNKLKSMDEVWYLVSLRALILNDNEIVSIRKLNGIKELNTLVLSRNPIREIGESLVEVKSITKLSLSNCHLQDIGSSLKSCIELKELRLGHNDIKTLPAELACNKKLQNLDLGNNVITTWSDVKVVTSLVDLKNLNLQGNPVTETDKLTKKVIKLLPDLHIFNAKPIEKGSKRGGSGNVDDYSHIPADKPEVPTEKKKDSRSFHEEVSVDEKDGVVVEKKLKRKKTRESDDTNDLNISDKQKRKKANEKFLKKDVDDGDVQKKPKSKKNTEGLNELDVIDNGDTSFADFFDVKAAERSEIGGEKKMVDKAGKEKNLNSGLVSVSAKKKKNKNSGMDSTVQVPPVVQVGIGGPSTWDD
ncbi:Leucine-rich repeat (LRR) family protein [Euphorbia peplus]|nr:Leucine-rich repeat (LRR) family protein [Euphorbia peplus]